MYSSELSQLNNLVCRITAKELGTGTIMNINDDISYILTCFHVIEDAKQIIIEQKLSNEVSKIIISSEDIIYCNDEAIDTAVIIISQKKYPNFCKPTEFLAVSNYSCDDANLCGFPGVKNTSVKYVNVPIDKGRIEESIFRTEIKLDTHTSLSSENCKGFSGGPIYIKHDGFLYICAIAKQYSDKLDYFTITNINIYNELLEANGFEKIYVFNESIMLCNTLIKSSCERIAILRSCIGVDIELPRNDFIDTMIKKTENIRIVYGEPGVGKSAILKNIAKNKTLDYFYFKSEDFNEVFPRKIEAIVEIAKRHCEILVIIDSAEKIFELQFEHIFILAITTFAKVSNIKLIIATRKYSLINLMRLIKIKCAISVKDISEFELGSLSNDDFRIVAQFFPDILLFHDTTKELLKNPFYLDVVISENLIGEIDNISNEYQIKDLIWENITEKNHTYKKVLIELLQAKLNSKTEYVKATIPDEIEKALIYKNIIVENNLYYRFAHDKYEDIASKKYFDFKSMEANITEIVKSIANPLTFGRAFKLWIKDRLTNDEIAQISEEIDALQNDIDVSYLWKWNIIESVYESKYFYNYLELKKKEIIKNTLFVKKLFEIAVSCDLMDLNVDVAGKLTTYQYFNSFAIPSFQTYTILRFFNNNRELISKDNFIFITNILSTTVKIAESFANFFSDLKIQWVMEFTLFLADKFKEYYKYGEDKSLKEICQSFIFYAPFFKTLSVEFIDAVCADIHNEFNSKFAKYFVIQCENYDNYIRFSKEFIKSFFNKLMQTFELFTTYDTKSRIFSFDYSLERAYDLNEELTHLEEYPQKTIIYFMFDIDFIKTLEFVITYLNKKIETFYGNRKNLANTNIVEQDFIFDSRERKVFNAQGYYSAFSTNSIYSYPNLFGSIAKAVMQQLILRSNNEDIEPHIIALLEKSNNLILISVAVNIVLMNMVKYHHIFAMFASNYFLRGLDIQRTISYSRLNFPIQDVLASESMKAYKKLIEKVYSFDNAFLDSQQYAKTQEKMLDLLDKMQHKNSDIEIRDFANNIDIRNLKIVEIETDKVILKANKSTDVDIKEYRGALNTALQLNDEYIKFYTFLTTDFGDISTDDVLLFIENYNHGRYNDINYTFENLDKYILLFYLCNQNLFNTRVYSKLISNFIKLLKNYQTFINNNNYVERLLYTISKLDTKWLSKYEEQITNFLFIQIHNSKIQHGNTDNIEEYIIIVCEKYSSIRHNLVSLLMDFCHFDEVQFDIHNRQYLNRETISIKELNKSKYSFKDKLINDFWNKDKQMVILDKINPENLFVIDAIVILASADNCHMIEQHLLQILKMMFDNQAASWYGKTEISLNISMSRFLLANIQNNWGLHELRDFTLLKYECFYKILINALDSISAYVQDETITVTDGWNFYKLVYEILDKCSYKKDLFYTLKSKFVIRGEYRNIGQLLMASLIIGHGWNNKFGAKKLKLLQSNESEYIEWIIKFKDSCIGVKCFAHMCYDYPEQLPKNYIFNNYKPLLQAFNNPSAFDEKSCVFYYELLCEKIYSDYEGLNETEKNIFYEFITSIGCNAPSAFLLYLKRKIEY